MSHRKRSLGGMAFLFILFSGISCVSYSFKGSLPSYLKTIYIPVFEDNTGYPGASLLLTQKVSDQFVKDNTLRTLGNREEADLILTGKIVSITVAPQVVQGGEVVESYLLRVNVSIECLDTHTQKPLWSGTISKDAPFENDYQPALEEVFDLIADEILNKTIAAW